VNDVLTDLSGDFSFLNSDHSGNPDFIGGNWDAGDVGFLSFPGDTGGEGDWMIPYIGPGGTDDVRGAVVVDAIDGTVDQATWLGGESWTQAELSDYLHDYFSLNLPLDIPQGTPEPASITLLLLGGGFALGLLRTRRGVTHYA
jgi:hypothetical protein